MRGHTQIVASSHGMGRTPAYRRRMVARVSSPLSSPNVPRSRTRRREAPPRASQPNAPLVLVASLAALRTVDWSDEADVGGLLLVVIWSQGLLAIAVVAGLVIAVLAPVAHLLASTRRGGRRSCEVRD